MSIPRTHPEKHGSAELAAVARSGEVVRLRPPRFSDHREWRRIRLRDRAIIEPFWATSPLSWEARHTQDEWVQECLHLRSCRRSRGFVIEVDGRFAGQVNLFGIDHVSRSAELGIWMDSAVGGRVIGHLAISILMDHAFTALGLYRLTAPICVDNLPAARGADRLGFVREATMKKSFAAGGRRKNHILFAMTADRVPGEGLTAQWSDPSVPLVLPVCSVDRRISPRSLAIGCRYVLGTAKRLAPGRASLQAASAHVGGLILRPVHALSPPLLRRHCGEEDAVLEGMWQPSSPLAGWSGHAFGYRVEKDGRHLGTVGFEPIDLVRHDATLRVDATGDDSHRALLQAAGWLLDRAFGVLNIERVQTGVDSCNAVAAGFAKALGLTLEGRMRGITTRDERLRDLDLWAKVADGSADSETPRLDHATPAGE
ncbi:GNAT family N-acetyltransferase [Rhodococcus sp. DMU2021]|uniref:GNAT family N-acetyltransferase n=1 Tax=Rhodococcus sp. DMU2021 TaxID=2866997 RepID=UPI001C7CCAA3|nr:GNAT family protein [Rhodococcus sp. DMU2021]MBX4169037.1 GNAT family N-acetyltransferase [Rhodococcus sp. DMU2021]